MHSVLRQEFVCPASAVNGTPQVQNSLFYSMLRARSLGMATSQLKLKAVGRQKILLQAEIIPKR